jgi:transcriptional regulator with XRE-family HTH domain
VREYRHASSRAVNVPAAHPGLPHTDGPAPAEPEAPPQAAPRTRARGAPLPLRPRGGFGGYLHELRRERGLTVRALAAAAGVHHTYISKLERGDRQAPEPAVVEALAAALEATPAQLDQLRWRAGLAPRGDGAPGQNDPTLTLVAEALADPARSEAERERLRRAVAHAVQGAGGDAWGAAVPHEAPPSPRPPSPAPPSLPVPEPPPDTRSALLAGLLGGWQTLDEAAAELRVTSAYLWDLVQRGLLRAWTLPGAAPGSPAGVRLRRDDVLALLQPVTPRGSSR